MSSLRVALVAVSLVAGAGSAAAQTEIQKPFLPGSPLLVRDGPTRIEFSDSWERFFDLDSGGSRLDIKRNADGKYAKITNFLWTSDGLNWHNLECAPYKRCDLVMKWGPKGSLGEVKISDNGSWTNRNGLKTRLNPAFNTWTQFESKQMIALEAATGLTEAKIVYGAGDSEKICRIGEKSPPDAGCTVQVIYEARP